MATDPDKHFMHLALNQAKLAAERNEVPVGAVVVVDSVVIAAAHNQTHTHNDPAGHAEIVALRRAATVQQSPRLVGASLYVTLEPCVMCVGAMIQARIDRLVYAAPEPKTGAIVSAFELAASAKHNHHFDVVPDVLSQSSVDLLQAFFSARRKAKTAKS